MPEELATWHAARKMVRIYGRDAAQEAAQVSKTFADRGDLEAAETWTWIAKVIAGVPLDSHPDHRPS